MTKDEALKPTKWIVNKKGGPSVDSFEISVIRENNRHGKESYGWFDKDKLLISSSGGPCRTKITRQVWDKLVKVAHEIADELNNAEKGKQA